MLNIALPKGRLGEKVYSLFERAGYTFSGILDNTRKLVFVNEELDMRCFWVKPFDVPVYVERGTAHLTAAMGHKDAKAIGFAVNLELAGGIGNA